MRIWIVYSNRQCSGHYTEVEIISTDQDEATDHYDYLKSGGGDQCHYPGFSVEVFDLEKNEGGNLTTGALEIG